ncbi:YgaP-like transmembrane domain [Pseudomonas matsuisoli]|uniref:DUF2892 domain-containing protein n=1 Tax=Pseudomonas matsuisoli TaxID=1515666 RepID=A0A917V0X5_9PSED|nr:YgaP-like transmembrane domain [Pseudomonas matsuisoli]GGK06317.1 hypothetical protein GCM10009304_35490 [Pseudomonas matsuisoli]
MSKPVDPNVHGWERAASIAGGLLLLGKGVRKGGLGGMLQLAMGGMAVARGFSGKCAAKRAIAEALNEREDARLAHSSATAVRGTTVAGHDSLVVPPPGAVSDPKASL